MQRSFQQQQQNGGQFESCKPFSYFAQVAGQIRYLYSKYINNKNLFFCFSLSEEYLSSLGKETILFGKAGNAWRMCFAFVFVISHVFAILFVFPIFTTTLPDTEPSACRARDIKMHRG